MNISNLQLNHTYKNYKQLCEVLELPTKTGNAKKAQLKDMERYFSYDKQGNKFIITEIYKTPKDKTDLRHSNRTLYVDYIEDLLINVLVNKKKLFLSRNSILRLLKMTNDNYIYYKYNQYKEIDKFADIDKEEIKDFYNTTDDLLKRNIETALNSLERKRLVFWNKAITVCFVNTRIDTNELDRIRVTKHEEITEDGNIIVSYDAAQPITNEIHRKATEEEQKLIWLVEKEILEEWRYKEISDVMKNHKQDEFYKLANYRLLQRGSIDYYYYSYEIICNEKYISETYNKIEDLQLTNEKSCFNSVLLNAGIMDKIEENAINRHSKAINDILSQKNIKNIVNLRSLETYLPNTNILTETLIDNEAKSIKPDKDKKLSI